MLENHGSKPHNKRQIIKKITNHRWTQKASTLSVWLSEQLARQMKRANPHRLSYTMSHVVLNLVGINGDAHSISMRPGLDPRHSRKKARGHRLLQPWWRGWRRADSRSSLASLSDQSTHRSVSEILPQKVRWRRWSKTSASTSYLHMCAHK